MRKYNLYSNSSGKLLAVIESDMPARKLKRLLSKYEISERCDFGCLEEGLSFYGCRFAWVK